MPGKSSEHRSPVSSTVRPHALNELSSWSGCAVTTFGIAVPLALVLVAGPTEAAADIGDADLGDTSFETNVDAKDFGPQLDFQGENRFGNLAVDETAITFDQSLSWVCPLFG